MIKKISIALFIYFGPLAYEFLQKNLHQALPSLLTIQRHIIQTKSCVEYDSQTDRCVGFVLPLSENGLSLIDSSFLAVSFDAIKNNMFATAKYAYVFMAQPLAQITPAFCLACFGIDNKSFFVPMKAFITILVAL